jgi:hypothetical protein
VRVIYRMAAGIESDQRVREIMRVSVEGSRIDDYGLCLCLVTIYGDMR